MTKEEMAIEHAEKQSCQIEHQLALANAYLAGFDRAKDLAIETANNVAIDIDYLPKRGDVGKALGKMEELDTQYNLGCWECAAAIANLGE